MYKSFLVFLCIIVCHTLLNKKRQNSNKFWRLTVCRKRA